MSARWLVMFLVLSSTPAFAQTVGMVEDWYDRETERRGAAEAESDAEDSAGRGAADQGLQLTQWGVGVMEAGQEAWSSWSALDSETALCGEAYSSASGPTVPSRCAESPECTECYEEAVRKIDFNRFYIERARCITATHIKMANSAMAFGDSASGVHAVAGMSWQRQGKPQIEEAVDKLKQTYKEKASQYLANLERELQGLAQCEAKFYGEQDWFQRYGWLYLNFMKAKYAAPPE